MEKEKDKEKDKNEDVGVGMNWKECWAREIKSVEDVCYNQVQRLKSMYGGLLPIKQNTSTLLSSSRWNNHIRFDPYILTIIDTLLFKNV